MNKFVGFLVALLSLALGLGASIARAGDGETVPVSAPHPVYVGSTVCAGCHEAEARAWRSSHHARAWMAPSEETVDGDFSGATFSKDGRTTRFFRRDGDYVIETEDFPGGRRAFKVEGVGGIAPLQQYLLETEPGRLQSFDVVWDQQKKRWYHLYPDQKLTPKDGLHWSGSYKTWNARCAECHATGFSKAYDLRTRSYSSTQAEIGVGCEACHGPGAAHVAWARAGKGGQSSPFPGSGDAGLPVSFAKGLPEVEIQQCAGCHARREPFADGNPLPGTPFHDSYRLALLTPGLYHPDGQILDEVYVYGSFLQSKMYDKGVRCSNCHEPHGGDLRAEGNAVCTQCHSPTGNAEFPSLTARRYDDPSHHFHEPGTAGAQCVSCHMIERVYMGIDGRRDHSFRVPRPDLTETLGTPNACTDCHADMPASWAAAELKKRFPESAHRGPHYGEVLAGAQRNPSGFAAELLELAGHDGFPGIVRATALNLLAERATPQMAARAAPLIGDADPLVRAAAVSVQRAAQPPERLHRIAEALEDPVKAVRIAAAREMLGLPVAHLPPQIDRAARSASKEWQAANAAKLDFPETHLVLGGTALAMRNPKAAVAAFGEVTRLDPQMVDAWIMQVRILLAVRDMAAAQVALQKGLSANPGDPNLTALKPYFAQ